MGRYNNTYGDNDDMNKEQNENVDSGFDLDSPLLPFPSGPADFASPSNVMEFWQLMKVIGQRRKWLISMGFLVLELGD